MSTQDLPTTVISELDQELIILTFPSVVRLLELDPNAALLYLFYCKTAKHQARQIGYTNRIKATSEFCRNGLHWGSNKFHRVKKILIENGFIIDIVRRSEHGAVQENYIQVNFLLNPHTEPNSSYKPLPSFEGTSHFPRLQEPVNEGTNADNKNRNADNKNIANENPSSYSNITPLSTKEGVEQVLSPISPESHSSKKALVPCSWAEIYHVAELKRVDVTYVKHVHDRIIKYVQDDEWKPRWGKTTYNVLVKWVEMGIGRGEIAKLDDDAMGVMRLMYSPEELRKTQESQEMLRKGIL